MKYRIWMMIASLLGFATACDIFDGPDMYGSPPVSNDKIFFQIQGSVTDDRGVPISNIKVSNNQGNSTRTAPNGSFDFSGSDFFFGTELVFTDVDGMDNGGQFKQATIRVEFTEADRTDNDRYEQTDLTVTLYKEIEQ